MAMWHSRLLLAQSQRELNTENGARVLYSPWPMYHIIMEDVFLVRGVLVDFLLLACSPPLVRVMTPVPRFCSITLYSTALRWRYFSGC